MSRQLISGRLATAIVAAVAVVAALSLAGCGNKISGNAQPAVQNGTIDAVSSTNTPRTSSAKPTSSGRPTTGARPSSGKPTATTSPSKGGNTDFQASVGDCVTLGGTTDNATIAKASCGSRASNYKVIGKAATSSQCVADRDSAYFETLNGAQQGAICLDIDWVVGGCMDISGEDPKRIDCTERVSQGVKVTNIEQGADDASVCGSSSGFEYPTRHFVVCVQNL
ncbi:hypothetical protein OG874_36215 [Nocardia sp. NBC_00565]|uniref:LppU family putative lipoprotein n=1 Tax=Nocardia sp. NBC_00565 TaxID=2975993 RepID=UPI002E7FEF56|nr:hypothetical protein [Nocardia sp. NBC_00565]WUC02128.1 hypothetical protein OG874_36215 [Nocardia sp. NBC_00565]